MVCLVHLEHLVLKAILATRDNKATLDHQDKMEISVLKDQLVLREVQEHKDSLDK